MKYYAIKSEEYDRLVLEEEKQVNFLRYAILIVPVGIMIYFTSRFSEYLSGAVPIGSLEFILAGLFICFGIVGGSFLFSKRSFIPYQLVFDNGKGQFEVSIRSGNEIKSAFIPYEEIKSFEVRQESANSTSQGRTTRKVYYYVVYILKKDGSMWDINTWYQNTSKAEAFRDKLAAWVKLDKPSRGFKPELPQGISVLNTGGELRIGWINRDIRSVVTVLTFFTGFGLTFAGIIGFEGFFNNDAFGLAILIPALSIFAIAIVIILYSTLNKAFGQYYLAVTRSGIEYGEVKNGNNLALQQMEMAQVAGVYYSYYASMNDNEELGIFNQEGLNSFYNITQEWKQRQDKDTKGFMDTVKTLFKSSGNRIILKITALDPVDKINLEAWLQKAITEKAGRPIL